MHTSPLVDPSLVRQALGGAPDATEALMGACLPTVVGWCARLGGPKVDAEDAAHDVMVVVLTRLAGLREPERFGSWLFGVTRRTLARHRRRAWVRRWVPGASSDGADPRADPAHDTELSELAAQVQRILEQIPEAQREVLVLCDVEERTDDAAAALLGIPSGTVKSRLRLGRARFRQIARGRALAPQFVGLTTWGQG